MVVSARAGDRARETASSHVLLAARGKSSTPVVIAVNKVDRLDQGKTVASAPGLGRPSRCRATRSFRSRREPAAGCRILGRLIWGDTPAGGPNVHSPVPSRAPTSPSRWLLAELVREKALARTREEVSARGRGRGRVDRAAAGRRLTRGTRWVLGRDRVAEGDLIGAGGRMIKAIGTAARKAIERELGGRGPPRPVRQGAP